MHEALGSMEVFDRAFNLNGGCLSHVKSIWHANKPELIEDY